MPALTPRMMRTGRPGRRWRRGSGRGRGAGALDLLGAQQPLADLTQRDGQRLLLDPGLHQRADVLQHALAELGEVCVDLPRPRGGHDDQAVLAVDDVQQVVDGRVDDAFRGRSACHVEPSGLGPRHTASAAPRQRPDGAVVKVTSWRHTSSTEVFTSVMSNSLSAASSSRAAASRRSITAGGSVSRPVRRRTSSSQDGGARKTSSAPSMARRTCRAPARSISSSTGVPAAILASTGLRGVPYQCPAKFAHSSSSPSRTWRWNSGSVMKWYSRPSASPGRGARVVTETESQTCGEARRSRATTVLLPTPEGPDRTVSRAGTGAGVKAVHDARSVIGSATDRRPPPRLSAVQRTVTNHRPTV